MFHSMNLGGARQRQGESADAGKQVGDGLGLADDFAHTRLQGRFAFGRGLQEGIGRQLHRDAVKADGGRGSFEYQLVIQCQPRDADAAQGA